MKDFLIAQGYNCWKTEVEYFGKTEHFQRRVDKQVRYKDYPLCYCNDKLLVNLTYHNYKTSGVDHEAWEAYIVHENSLGEWCDIKIYSLSEENIKTGLDNIERKLLNMWKVFNE